MASAAELKRYIKDRISVSKTGCWEWQRVKNKGGYGQCRVGKKVWTIHRLAFTLWKGPIGRGLFIRHKCDNTSCCRPSHLEPGMHEDNTSDIVLRKKPRRVLRPEEVERAIAMRISGQSVNAIATALECSFYLAKAVVQSVPGKKPGRPKGSKNFRVRITDEIKNTMRREYAAGGITQQKLADRFGCSQDYVSIIVRQPER